MSRTSLPVLLMLFLTTQAEVSAGPSLSATQIVHLVQPGETIWTIARRHGLAANRIVTMNRLQNPDRLQIGERLAIPTVAPPRAGAVSPTTTSGRKEEAHVVRSGETLWSVARDHGTTVTVLAERNGLVNVDTSRFGFRGRRHHHGVDIAAPIGTPIFAVRDGTVRFAGRKGAYGLLVILEHGDGLTTWYGHASRILVTVGERVTQGQTIAAIGTTGNITGPNVHSEVRRNDVPLDPLRFLQSR